MIVPKDYIESGSGRRCWVHAELYGKNRGEVDAKKKEYFGRFPPQGYDTHTTVVLQKHHNGYWFTHLKRYSSCD